MKQNRYLTLLIMAGALSGFAVKGEAQSFIEPRLSVGVKGGGGVSRVLFTPTIKQGLLPGGHAGVMVRYIEENHFGLIGEINFEQRGWKEDFEGYSYEYQRTLNYLQIPLLSHVYFGNKNHFFINLGPELGILLGESTKANFDYRNIDQIPDFPSKLRTTYQYQMVADQRIDYGISAGFGAEFPIGGKGSSAFIEGRGYLGLGNVLKSGRTELFKGSNSLNVSVSAGYWFTLKR